MKRQPEHPLERIASELRILAENASYRGQEVTYSIKSDQDGTLLIKFESWVCGEDA